MPRAKGRTPAWYATLAVRFAVRNTSAMDAARRVSLPSVLLRGATLTPLPRAAPSLPHQHRFVAVFPSCAISGSLVDGAAAPLRLLFACFFARYL